MARTGFQLIGDRAENDAARFLVDAGWSILGRNVRLGRIELDIVGVDPGPPARLVVVEVRWRSRRDWGAPEETFDRRKAGRLRNGLARLLVAGMLPDGTRLPRAAPAIDLIALEPGADATGPPRLLHLRDIG